MCATVEHERVLAERNQEQGMWAVFKGRNLIRFIIAGWPKITQQFVGLSVFNTYATYFCKAVPPYLRASQLTFQSNMLGTRIRFW
jgi:hypothetical protein